MYANGVKSNDLGRGNFKSTDNNRYVANILFTAFFTHPS